ncbi:MAG: GxxExxY protein [Paludibacteraceae bacterium]|nr:GxxExxY protein [Paludibacteraceae bacterium]
MEFFFKQETYDINGAAMHVYNVLGPGFLESVYQEALAIEFKKRNIPFEREKELKIFYDGQELSHTFKTDFYCYDKIIVELKAVSELNDSHRSQLFNYLKATNSKVGLLINFGSSHGVEIERKVK